MRQNLDIDPVDLVTLETAAEKFFLDLPVELIVDDVRERVVHGVVKMEMLECVDIEVHLVVLAHPAVVDSKQGKLRQDVVHGRHGHLGLSCGRDLLRDHIGAGVAQFQHSLVHRQSLWGDFQSVVSQLLAEILDSQSLVVFFHLF